MGTVYGYGNSYFAIQAQSAMSRLDIGSYGFTRFMVGAGVTEAMRIASTGNVGIGTATPATRLHIESTTPDSIYLKANTS
jgi:hypothetical protein